MSTDGYELGDEVRHLETKQVGILIDVNTHDQAERDANDEYFAEAQYRDRTFIIDVPEDIVRVRKKADVPAPKLPMLDEVADYLSSAAHSGFGDIQVSQTDTNEPPGEFLLYGEHNGTPFGCRVTISEIDWTDL